MRLCYENDEFFDYENHLYKSTFKYNKYTLKEKFKSLIIVIEIR